MTALYQYIADVSIVYDAAGAFVIIGISHADCVHIVHITMFNINMAEHTGTRITDGYPGKCRSST